MNNQNEHNENEASLFANDGDELDVTESSLDLDREEIALDTNDFDARSWEEEHVPRVPGFLKLLMFVGLMCFLGFFFLNKFTNNAPYEDAIEIPTEVLDGESQLPLSNSQMDELSREEALALENDLSLENGNAEGVDVSLDSSDTVADVQAVESVEDAAHTDQAIDEFLAQDGVKVTNNGAAVKQVTQAAPVVKKKAEEKAKTVTAKKVETPKAKTEATSKPVVKSAPATEVKTPEPKLAEKTVETKSSSTASDSAIASMPDSAYAIQLIGMNDAEGFKAFVAKLPSDLNVHTYQRMRQDKSWNVAILAPYDNAEQAKAAIQSLPETLQANKPWIKSLAEIKKQLK